MENPISFVLERGKFQLKRKTVLESGKACCLNWLTRQITYTEITMSSLWLFKVVFVIF